MSYPSRPLRTLVAWTSTIASMFSVIAVVGCGRPADSLVGSWKIDGPTPTHHTFENQLTAVTFRGDGGASVSFLPAGTPMLPPELQPKLHTNQDRYETVGDGKIRLIEGSSASEYSYDIRNGHLYLTAAPILGEQMPTLVLVRRS